LVVSRDNQSRVIIGAAIALVLIIAMSITTSISYASANRWVDHTLLVEKTSADWLAAVLGAETRARGYAVAGNPVFLRPYETSLTDAESRADEMAHLVADNPVQGANVEKARGDMRAAFDRLREIVTLTTDGRPDAAREQVSSEHSKQSVDTFRDDVRAIVAEEDTLLDERRSHVRTLAIVTFSMTALLMVGSVSLLGLSWSGQRRRESDIRTLANVSKHRLDALATVATALANAHTRSEVGRVVVEEGMRVVEADTCTLYMLDSSGETLELIGDRGVLPEVIERIKRISKSSETDATFETLASGKSLWAETVTEYTAMFPGLAPTKTDGKRARAFWSMPLIVEEHAVGLLGMGFFEERSFAPDERAFIETFVRQCAQALVRATRLESERATQEWFATTLNSIGDAVIATDPDGNVTFVNAVAEKLTAWPRAEARGKKLDEVFSIFSEQTRKSVENPVVKVLREGAVVGLANHTVLRSRRGDETPIDDSAAPIRDEQGTLYGVVLVFRDVTDEKREQVRREFLARAGEALVSSNEYRSTLATVAQLAVPQLADWCAIELVEEGKPRQVAVAHVDPSKVAFAKELGERYPPDANAPTGVPQVIRSGKPELYAEIPKEMLERGARDAEHLRIIRELNLQSAMVVPLRIGGHILGAMTFIHAESGRRYNETDLAFAEDFARRAAMAIENATSMTALERARSREKQLREQAELANRAKDEFLATVSHELRTPLTAILGWTLLLRGRKLEADVDQPLFVIERNARAQMHLVEDVLDVSRIISGKLMLNLVAVNAADVVRAAIESVTPSAEAKSLRIHLAMSSEPLTITADQNRLQQVMWNLVTNAVKFTARGDVRVAAVRDGDSIAITVSDTGEGIRADVLPHVFEPFQQADTSATRRHGGLGLGLAIVKHIVTAHGGTVTASSDGEGKGATFEVRLPARSTAPAVTSMPSQPAALPRLDGLRVLVLDDEDDARMLVGAVLRDQGAKIDAFSSASAALDQLELVRPDVIVSDIAMPQMDGYTFIRSVRALPPAAGGRTPAVALTAFARVEDAQRAFAAGYQMHVAKPIEPAQLVTMVANLGGRTQEHG
jgi:PAS domain S-box-containing protein